MSASVRLHLATLAAQVVADQGEPALAVFCAPCDRLLIATRDELPADCSCGRAWEPLPALAVIDAICGPETAA